MSIIDKLGEQDTIRKLELGEPSVSGLGIDRVNSILYKSYGHKLPSGFTAEYVTGMGKFPSRVANFMKAYHGIDLNNEVKEEIGNVASRYTARADSIIFDITKGLMEWPAGSFGNYRSCYRSTHKSAVAALKEVGTLAFRLFKPGGHWYGKYRGVGRAWLIPYKNSLIVANGYGPKTTPDYAEIVSQLVDEPYNEVRRVKSTEGLIYINNSSGYIVGPENPSEVLITMDWISMEICAACGKKFTYKRPDVDKIRHNDRFYCFDCVGQCEVNKLWYPHYALIYCPGAVVEHRGKIIRIKEYINDSLAELVTSCSKCDTVVGRNQEHVC